MLDIWISQGLAATPDCLSAEEKARGQRLIHEHDRRTFTQAHGLKRLLCSHYCPHLPPHHWRFQRHNAGKPYALSPFPYAFNLSHSSPFIAVAIAGDEVGVDIEANRELDDFERLANATLLPREQRWLSHQDDIERAFFRLWTMKEAILKAAATGFAVHPTQIECRELDAPSATARLHGQQWRCWTHSEALCLCSVAIPDKEGRRPRFLEADRAIFAP
ncbi:4'-phosphopantetheinyl transferase family protein [Halomonadaceae bacterium KBTZ08]